MSIETTCKDCGAEYDMRHDSCPACTVEVNLRSLRPPYETWMAVGYLPFEMYAERFAVTRIPCGFDDNEWRVSHVRTGAAVPKTDAETKEGALDKAKRVLAEVGAEKFRAAMAKLEALIANTPVTHGRAQP